MHSQAQQAAIAIVSTVPRTVRFGTVPVTCEDLLIGHVDREYVEELTERAENSPARPQLTFGPQVRGGMRMGVVDSIAVVTDNDDRHVVEKAGRRITLAIPHSGECVTLRDEHEGYMPIDIDMIDEIVASLLALKTRAGR